MTNDEIITNIILKLEIEDDFILKEATKTSARLTVHTVISKIIEGDGNLRMDTIFKGYNPNVIRKILTDLFIEYPKPSPAQEWYLHMLSVVGLKKCPSCKSIKPITHFSKNIKMKSQGVDSWCLTCVADLRSINNTRVKDVKRKHQIDNKHAYAEASARRRARKLKASPTWANIERIKEIYKKCPEGYHVDHWAPLQGTNVCGLHTEYNLQYILAQDNISKSNKFSDTDEFIGTW